MPTVEKTVHRLNLAGRESRIPGFTNIDLTPGPSVDIIGDVSDLKDFSDGSVEEIYASHILEHFPHLKGQTVLREWRRVLRPGASAFISVPDMAIVARLTREFGWCEWLRNLVYGDQTDKFAFHYGGFDFAFLSRELVLAGFSDVVRIKEMPYGVNDRSRLICSVNGEDISLNVKATA